MITVAGSSTSIYFSTMSATYHIPFSESEVESILESCGCTGINGFGPVYVSMESEGSFDDWLDLQDVRLAEYKKYFLTTRSHALQISLSRIGMYLFALRAREASAVRYNKKELDRLRNYADKILTDFGVADGCDSISSSRAHKSGQFTWLSYNTELIPADGLDVFCTLLRGIRDHDYSSSPVGFLKADDDRRQKRKPTAAEKFTYTETYLLKTIWTDLLRQEARMTFDPITDSVCGPIIDFFEVVLNRWNPDKKLTRGAIRDRLRRAKLKARRR